MTATRTPAGLFAADPRALIRAWTSFRDLLGVSFVRTRSGYDRARATIESLVDEIGEDEEHPLAEVLEFLFPCR